MWVGRPLPRTEDPALLRGEGLFVADVAARLGAMSCRFVRSPVAAGQLRSVCAPADVTMFTAIDLAGVRPIRGVLHRPDFVPTDQPVLADDVVRFTGEPIAVVVAASPEHAEDAADRAIVDIRPTAAVVDAEAALRPDAPLVHSRPSALGPNTVVDARFATPGVEAAFAAAHSVVELTITSKRQNAAPLETRGAVAEWSARDGRVTLHTATQAPHVVRTGIADLLGMRESELRVVAGDVGGAFGQKLCLAREDVVVVWLARRLRRAVAWIEDRVENLTAAWHSRDQRHRVRGAFAADGELLALDVDTLCNVGAYSCYPITYGVEPLMALSEFPGPYDLAEYRVRSRGVLTNTCPMAPYRGVSRPAITLAVERLLDVAARRLAFDPITLRRRNLVKSFPHRSPTGLVLDEGSYVAALDTAAAAIDVDGFRHEQAVARGEGRLLGLGFSVFAERTGYGTPAFSARSMDVTPGYETVELTMDPSGQVEARIGASPHGQGLATALAQVIADRIGLDPGDIGVVHGDTDRTPYGWGTFASRSMVLAGGAATLAALELAEQLAAIAGEILEASPADIVLDGGRARVAGTDVGLPIAELARTAYHSRQRLPEGVPPGLSVRATYDPAGTFSNACHAAVVEVDPETGHVRMRRFVVVEDAGLLVNPMLADGQVHGGVAQGIANALLEEIVYDDVGTPLTASFLDFLPPTAMEVPEIEVHHLETPSNATLTGAKGLGEGGTIGAPAAVLNAISDAISHLGVEVCVMPATPFRVRDLIRIATGTAS